AAAVWDRGHTGSDFGKGGGGDNQSEGTLGSREMLDRVALTKRIQSNVDGILSVLIIRFLPQGIRPNHLTFLRLVLVAPLILLLAAQLYWQSLVLFLFLSLLDLVDGALARTRDERSDLGKVLDPFADKILVGATLLLVGPPLTGWGVIILTLSIEGLIIAGGLLAKLLDLKTEANLYGKLKMDLQVLGIVLLILGGNLGLKGLLDGAVLVFYLAILFAVLSVLASSSYFKHIGWPWGLLKKLTGG
ncbi:MAG: CDP-alcohol phosphatidyltransferase family protein, partial [Chloroflexi bacterium]|nr:CDP-alcohol phosphatidyltransferase family protein [Chloroflexota bacterium]